MRVHSIAGFSILVVLAVFLSGCGGGSKTSSGGENPVAVTGVFVDSPVQGLDYGTATQQGITGPAGEFSYVPSENVTFAIGGIILGRGLGLDLLTPIDLVLEANDETDPAVTNITRLLLTLDNDQIPDNGITIAQSLRTAALNFNVDLQQDITTETQLQDLVDQLTAAVTSGSGTVGTSTRTLVSVQFAQDHLASTLLSLDTTPPDVTIDAGPPDPANSTSATFTFSSSEFGTAFSCRLDDADFTTCASPQDYSALSLGAHEFVVRAMDPSGNAADATWTWTVDLSLDVSITAGPDAITNDPTANFQIILTVPATLECSLDDVPLVSCDAPQVPDPLDDGPHTFRVLATVDPGGITDEATWTWTIDTVPPDVSIDSGPSGTTTDDSATFAFSSSDPDAAFSCAMDTSDPADFTACISPVSYQDVFSGAHQFQVIATDPAGNTASDSRSWTVNDETAPDNAGVVINDGAATTESTTATLTLTARDTGSGVDGYCVKDDLSSNPPPGTPSAVDICFNDVAPAAIDYSDSLLYTFAGSYTPGPLPDGTPITVYVWYRDASGNVTAAPAVAAIGLVDQTQPTVDTLIIDPPVAPDDPNGNAATYALLADRITVELEASDNLDVTGYFVSEHDATDPANISPPVVEPLPSEIVSVPQATGPTIIEHPLAQTYPVGNTIQMCGWAKDGVDNVSPVKCDAITYGVDWESGIGSWTTENTVNKVWRVNPFEVSTPFGSCFGGDEFTSCAGTGLSGQFPPEINDRLISPTIVLPTVSAPATIHLRFQNAYDYLISLGTTGHGQVQIQVFDDTVPGFGPWQDVVGARVDGDSPDWEPNDVDLTAYAGDKVRVGFQHVADDQTGQVPGPTRLTSAGWFIDDVQIVIE